MSWIAQALGLGLGAVLGGKEGAEIGHTIGGVVGKMLASPPEQALAAQVLARTDDLGSALEFHIAASVPRGALAFVDVLNTIDDPLCTRDTLLSDTHGQFLSAAEIRDQRCRAYVPYSALEYRRAGMYTVRLRCIWYDQARSAIDQLGQARFQLLLPPPSPTWNRFELARPLVWLAMRLIRADETVKRSEIRSFLRIIIRELELDLDDLPALRQAMHEQPSMSIERMVALLMARFPVMDANALVSLLARLAWADGSLDKREVAVIRTTAASLGLSKNEWHQIVRTHNLQG